MGGLGLGVFQVPAKQVELPTYASGIKGFWLAPAHRSATPPPPARVGASVVVLGLLVAGVCLRAGAIGLQVEQLIPADQKDDM